MLKIGLTGGIGSGKSSACRHFAALGVPVIDTDQIAREVVARGSPVLAQLCKDFGPEILDQQGELDRQAMRQRVFADPPSLALLEQRLHPAIRAELHRQLATLHTPYVILAIPLLVEKSWQHEVDRVLVVDCSEQQQLERASQRDGCEPDIIRRIITRQISRQQRLAAADDILHNDGSPESLVTQVAALHRRYLELATQGP